MAGRETNTDRRVRWYDDSKVIWSLIGLLSVIGVGVGGWSLQSSSEHGEKIKAVEIRVDSHEKSIRRIDDRFDRTDTKVDEVRIEVTRQGVVLEGVKTHQADMDRKLDRIIEQTKK